MRFFTSPPLTPVPLASHRRVDDVNLKVGWAIGREPDWTALRETGKRRSPYTARWTLDLDESELDAVEGVLDGVADESREEFQEMLERVGTSGSPPTLWQADS